MELDKVLLTNYLPYAKATIVARAIPGIDGFKPVQRRFLYTMDKMGLQNGGKVKSQKITGQTMSLHPHADTSIYEAIVLMTTGYEGMNVPFVESKGSFGKVYSRDLQFAAARYTEAKLAPIAKELFDGINENAVDMVPNFDGTEIEPSLLPTKFPNVLVNNSTGVAVGTSSNIPCFSLVNVCNSTIGILDGSIKTFEDLADTLGAPEFTTGGFLHASKESLVELCKTGKGSFVISGKVEVYNDHIVITEIPYCTTAEDIMDEIEEAIKEKKMRGIRDVRDEIGLEGLRIVVDIKSGYNSREVLAELCKMTSLRTSISFRTRVIVNNRCRKLNLMELLQEWIEFRANCIKRVYTFRLNKLTKEEHLEATWEKIKDHLKEVVLEIASNTEEGAKSALMNKYGLDEIQADYLLDMRIKSITTNKATAAIKKLADIRENITKCNQVISDDKTRNQLIISELRDIVNKYGKKNKTTQAPEIVENNTKTEIKISDELVTVVLTKAGYLRRLSSIRDISTKFVAKNGDEEVKRWAIKNNEHLLVFDRFGTVHKILVDSIDSSSKATMTDKLIDMANIEKIENIVWIDACGDYSGHFNLVMPNGRGRKVYYSDAKGNRSQYKRLYEEVQPGAFWVTTEDEFFMITQRNKAAYCNLGSSITNRVAFKVARVSPGDYFTRLQPAKDVPNIGLIDISRYNKDYTVSIGKDILWVDPAKIALADEILNKKLAEYNKSSENTDKADNKVEESSNNSGDNGNNSED